MICSACKKELPGGSTKCPHCNAEVNTEERRCPNCWARLGEGVEHCPKCGCDIKERLKEIDEEKNAVQPTFADRIKQLPKWIRIMVPAVIVALILIFASVGIYSTVSDRAEAARLADDYVISVNLALDNITKLAQAYEDMVYKKSWLDHTGSAAAIREVYAEEISLIQRTREPVYYSKTRIEKLGNKKISVAVNMMYESYTKCYNYVIGENGKYPGYMKEYKRLLGEYEKTVKALKKEIEKYK